jgi:hypothetical protein
MSTPIVNRDVDDDTLLYESLKDLPDFDCFPIPNSWFKKFNLPPRNPESVKDFFRSGYTMKCAMAPKDLPPIEVKNDGIIRNFPPPEPLPKTDVLSRPLEGPIGMTLPSLTDEGIEQVRKQLGLDTQTSSDPKNPAPTHDTPYLPAH